MQTSSEGIVLSGGGVRSGYAVGALRALAEVHGIIRPRVIVPNSGSVGASLFYLICKFKEMYDWAHLFDDPRFISWKRVWRGPIMDIDFLVDKILLAQVPHLREELLTIETRWFIATTRFPECTPHWFTKESQEPLRDILKAAKTASGVCGTTVECRGIHFADGHFSISLEDCVEKAFAEGATRVIVIDNATYGKSSLVERLLVRHGVRKAPSYVQAAVDRLYQLETRPMTPRQNVIVCRNENLCTRHGLVRAARFHRASIEQGYADMANLHL